MWQSLPLSRQPPWLCLSRKFKNDPARTSTGRSQRALPADQKSSIVEFVHKLFPEGHILDSAKIPDKIKNEQLVPAAFIVAKSWVTASAEAGHLPTCRIGFGGTRAVVAVHTSSLLEHVSQGGGGKADLARCYQWLKSASKEAAKAFVDANPTSKVLFHATVGPNDIPAFACGVDVLRVHQQRRQLLRSPCSAPQFVIVAPASPVEQLLAVIGKTQCSIAVRSGLPFAC